MKTKGKLNNCYYYNFIIFAFYFLLFIFYFLVLFFKNTESQYIFNLRASYSLEIKVCLLILLLFNSFIGLYLNFKRKTLSFIIIVLTIICSSLIDCIYDKITLW